MNKARRKELHEAVDLLYKALSIIDSVKEGEEEAYDNLPESFQYSEKGETMQEHIDTLDDAYGQVEDLTTILEEIVGI